MNLCFSTVPCFLNFNWERENDTQMFHVSDEWKINCAWNPNAFHLPASKKKKILLRFQVCLFREGAIESWLHFTSRRLLKYLLWRLFWDWGIVLEGIMHPGLLYVLNGPAYFNYGLICIYFHLIMKARTAWKQFNGPTTIRIALLCYRSFFFNETTPIKKYEKNKQKQTKTSKNKISVVSRHTKGTYT